MKRSEADKEIQKLIGHPIVKTALLELMDRAKTPFEPEVEPLPERLMVDKSGAIAGPDCGGSSPLCASFKIPEGNAMPGYLSMTERKRHLAEAVRRWNLCEELKEMARKCFSEGAPITAAALAKRIYAVLEGES